MNKSAKPGGRPAGRTTPATIEVAIEPEIKNAFMEKLSQEGKKASIEIGLWIREYLKDNKEN